MHINSLLFEFRQFLNRQELAGPNKVNLVNLIKPFVIQNLPPTAHIFLHDIAEAAHARIGHVGEQLKLPQEVYLGLKDLVLVVTFVGRWLLEINLSHFTQISLL